MKKFFQNKKVTVMGIGLHGGAVETIKWFVSQGASVVATDKKSEKELRPSLEKLKKLKNVSIITDQHRLEDFESADLVVKNPAVPWDNKYIQAALKKNIPVEMDSSLFFKYALSSNIIGVTGTKGKTTTSLLVAHILQTAEVPVVRVGIGQEPVLSKLDQIQSKEDWIVFELSSWRLSALKNIKKSPKVSLITNIYPDHLNYYKSLVEYVEDKKNIFNFQKEGDVLLLNRDNQYTQEFESSAKGDLGFFSFEKIQENMCVYVENDEIRYNNDGDLGMICPVKDVPLRGSHNLHNVLAASLVAFAIGIDPKDICKGIKTFPCPKHRLEFVANFEKIAFYNDSAATTPEAAIAGINSFSKPIILICGGANKKLELLGLAKEISRNKNVKKVVFLKGSATSELAKLVEEQGGWEKVVGTFDNFEVAIESARQNAKEGFLVLLSPGCASFGMFENEFDRGDQFRKIVEKMQQA